MKNFFILVLISLCVAQDTAGAGATCGGIAGIQCGTRLRCDYGRGKTTPPNTDATGTCRQVCGGLAGFQCPANLQCVYANGNTTPPYPDASGLCECPLLFCPAIACVNMSRPPPDENGCTGCSCCTGVGNCGGVGAMCGGIAGFKCNTGLQCIYANGSTTPSSPDASGVCACPRVFCPMIACRNMLTPPPDQNGCTSCSCCVGISGCGGGGAVQVGGHCGGNIQNPPQCAPGLQCVLGSLPDAGGTCQPVYAQVGEHCGGNIQNPPQCASGLQCVLGSLPDAGGTCQPVYAQVGEHCGGNIQNPPQCASGLQCVLGSLPDAGGTCQPVYAQLGEHCGGNIQNPPQCAPGLHCVLGFSPDTGGTCQQQQVCPADARICPDGTTLIRDPNNNCDFPTCPQICTSAHPCASPLRCNLRCQKPSGRIVSVCQLGSVPTLGPRYPVCP